MNSCKSILFINLFFLKGGCIIGLVVGDIAAPVSITCEEMVKMQTPAGQYAREQASLILPEGHSIRMIYEYNQGGEFLTEENINTTTNNYTNYNQNPLAYSKLNISRGLNKLSEQDNIGFDENDYDVIDRNYEKGVQEETKYSGR